MTAIEKLELAQEKVDEAVRLLGAALQGIEHETPSRLTYEAIVHLTVGYRASMIVRAREALKAAETGASVLATEAFEVFRSRLPERYKSDWMCIQSNKVDQLNRTVFFTVQVGSKERVWKVDVDGQTVTQVEGDREPEQTDENISRLMGAMATGLLNDHRVYPDDPESGLPPVNLMAFTSEQGLKVTVLDVLSWNIYDVPLDLAPSGNSNLADMNTADLIAHYGEGFAEIVRAPHLAEEKRRKMRKTRR